LYNAKVVDMSPVLFLRKAANCTNNVSV